jgi:PmbA protein
VADLIAGCERGILVTRFHYTNVVNPKQTVLTGMTRDGTFLIEDGRIVRPVRNLRFTQSVLGALQDVQAISTETRYATELFGEGARFPAVRLGGFTFSGTTSFG